jgi:hypothetical protein
MDAFYGSQSYINLKDGVAEARPLPESAPAKGYSQYAYDKNYPPQRDADAQYLYDLQTQMQLQEQYASTQKTHAAKASKPKKLKGNSRSGRSASDSDSSEYDGQLIDYADGTNKDFFFVANTNTYIDTEKRPRHSNRHPQRQQSERGGKGSQDYSYPTQSLPYQQQQQMMMMPQGYYAPSSHTRSSSNSSSIPTTATTTTGTASSHTAFDQQVEIQKQIFQEYERKKHSKRPDVSAEAAEARERLLRQQESLLSASVDSLNDGLKVSLCLAVFIHNACVVC